MRAPCRKGYSSPSRRASSWPSDRASPTVLLREGEAALHRKQVPRLPEKARMARQDPPEGAEGGQIPRVPMADDVPREIEVGVVPRPKHIRRPPEDRLEVRGGLHVAVAFEKARRVA